MTDLATSISSIGLAEARLKHLGCSTSAAIVIALSIEKQKGRERRKDSNKKNQKKTQRYAEGMKEDEYLFFSVFVTVWTTGQISLVWTSW